MIFLKYEQGILEKVLRNNKIKKEKHHKINLSLLKLVEQSLICFEICNN